LILLTTYTNPAGSGSKKNQITGNLWESGTGKTS